MNPQHFTLVTGTFPVLNDATLQDAYLVGLYKVAHLMEKNGIPEPFPGTIIEKVSVELRALIEESDLLISKGGIGSGKPIQYDNKTNDQKDN